MQAIFQAYQLRCMCWYMIALRARSQDDVHGYNEAQLELCEALNSLHSHMPDLQLVVKQKIEDLKQARLSNCEAKYDSIDSNDLTSHRQHPGQSKYHTAGYVYDEVSKAKVLHASLKPPTTFEKVGDYVNALGSFFGSQIINP